MMKRRILFSIGFGALLCGVAALVYFTGPSVEDVEKPNKPAKVTQGGKKPPKVNRRPPTREHELLVKVGNKNEEKAFRVELPKDEEANLTDAYKKLLQELRDVIDPLDRKKLLALVHRMQSSEEWPDGIPSILHEAAIEALSELGADGASELAGYLESGDADVREDAMDAIIESVDDDALSDREKSEMIKSFARCINDADALESLFDIIDMDMRNSVQIDTMKVVLVTGTSAAKQKILEETLPEVIDSEDPIKLEDANRLMDEWFAENPDGEDDETDYAGTPKDDDDEDDDD